MYCIFFSWNILSDGSSSLSLEQNPSSSIFCFTIQYLANVACCLSITLFTFRDEGRMFLSRINDLHVLSQICVSIVKFRSQIKRSNIHTSLSRNGDHTDRGKYDIKQQPISGLPCPGLLTESLQVWHQQFDWPVYAEFRYHNAEEFS